MHSFIYILLYTSLQKYNTYQQQQRTTFSLRKSYAILRYFYGRRRETSRLFLKDTAYRHKVRALFLTVVTFLADEQTIELYEMLQMSSFRAEDIVDRDRG